MRNLIIGIVLTLVVAGAVGGCFIIAQDEGYTSYSGTLTFSTGEQYQQFKEAVSQAMTDEKAYISELGALSSQPPILVKFDLRVDRDPDWYFPYGEKSIQNYAFAGAGEIAGFISAMLFMTFTLSIIVLVGIVPALQSRGRKEM